MESIPIKKSKERVTENKEVKLSCHPLMVVLKSKTVVLKVWSPPRGNTSKFSGLPQTY